VNTRVLDNLFKAADDLNDAMIYDGFCRNNIPNTKGVLHCYKCTFHNNKGCILNNALSLLDEAKSAYKILKNN
jgi:hypothetical protein